MSEQLTLPSGATAELRSSLTVGGRKLLKRAKMAMLGTPLGQAIVSTPGYEDFDEKAAGELFVQLAQQFPLDAAELGDAENEALVLGYVAAWSFALPLSAEGVQELDEDDFTALVAAAKKIEDSRVTAEQLADVSPDPLSPTRG